MAVMLEDRLLLLMLALYVSLLLGGPRTFHALLGLDRPGRWLRHVGATLGERLNRPQRPVATRRSRGLFVLICLVMLAVAAGMGAHALQGVHRWGFALEVLLLAAFLPLRPPLDAAGEVVRQLKAGKPPEAARYSEMFLRRDPQGIDTHHFCRACIEHLVRSLSWVTATAFWYLLGGLPMALAVAFTLRLAARFEAADPQGAALNRWPRGIAAGLRWIPERLAALFLLLAAPLVPGARLRRGLAALDSEKGSILENLTAGILQVALGGPRRWRGAALDEPWIGEGTAKARAADVTRARVLTAVAGGLLILTVTALNL